MGRMRKLIVVAVAASLAVRSAAGQQRLQRVESARIGPDHRVYLRWTGQPESVQVSGEEQAGTEELKVAPDRSAAGWLVTRTDLSDASYPEAFELLMAWNGRPARSIFPGRVIGEWRFENGGRNVAIWDETGHGGRFGKATLYESSTGKLLATWSPDSKTAPPSWAAPLYQHWNTAQ
jgi:hypothetical protein